MCLGLLLESAILTLLRQTTEIDAFKNDCLQHVAYKVCKGA